MPIDYIYLRAWHELSGSLPYYVDMMVERARKEGAPKNAIYPDTSVYGSAPSWKTLDDVSPTNHFKDQVIQYAERKYGAREEFEKDEDDLEL